MVIEVHPIIKLTPFVIMKELQRNRKEKTNYPECVSIIFVNSICTHLISPFYRSFDIPAYMQWNLLQLFTICLSVALELGNSRSPSLRRPYSSLKRLLLLLCPWPLVLTLLLFHLQPFLSNSSLQRDLTLRTNLLRGSCKRKEEKD